MKTLESILHMYLGCDVMTPDGIGKLVGLPWHVMNKRRVSVHFGRMVKTKHACDGDQFKTRNYGDYLIHEEHLEAISSTDPDMQYIHLPGGIKPILRPLDSMTEEEEEHMISTQDDVRLDGYPQILLKADSGETFRWMLSKGFDLFGLIDSGLAIDATKLEGYVSKI